MSPTYPVSAFQGQSKVSSTGKPSWDSFRQIWRLLFSAPKMSYINFTYSRDGITLYLMMIWLWWVYICHIPAIQSIILSWNKFLPVGLSSDYRFSVNWHYVSTLSFLFLGQTSLIYLSRFLQETWFLNLSQCSTQDRTVNHSWWS